MNPMDPFMIPSSPGSTPRQYIYNDYSTKYQASDVNENKKNGNISEVDNWFNNKTEAEIDFYISSKQTDLTGRHKTLHPSKSQDNLYRSKDQRRYIERSISDIFQGDPHRGETLEQFSSDQYAPGNPGHKYDIQRGYHFGNKSHKNAATRHDLTYSWLRDTHEQCGNRVPGMSDKYSVTSSSERNHLPQRAIQRAAQHQNNNNCLANCQQQQQKQDYNSHCSANNALQNHSHARTPLHVYRQQSEQPRGHSNRHISSIQVSENRNFKSRRSTVSSVSSDMTCSSADSYDITGQTDENRYPWLRDVGVQCEIRTINNNTIVNENINSDSQHPGFCELTGNGTGNGYDNNRDNNTTLICNKERIKSTSSANEDERIPPFYVKNVSDGVFERATGRASPNSPVAQRRRRQGVAKRDAIDRRELTAPTDAMETLGKDLKHASDLMPSPLVSPMTSPHTWRRSLPEVVAGSFINGVIRQNSMTHHVNKLTRSQTLPAADDTESDDSLGRSRPPAIPRRGRRAAIFESQDVGDVCSDSDTDPRDLSDVDSDHQNLSSRRRSSLDLVNHGDVQSDDRSPTGSRRHSRKFLTKRNTIADFGYQSLPTGSTLNLAGDHKEKKSFLLKLMDKKNRTKEISKLEDVLRNMKLTEFKDNHLTGYKDAHWSELIASTDKHILSISELERKRREAVWELFKSECVFLIDHLMVLKHVFMEPLKKVQVEDHLMFAEPQNLFGNLDELCFVSYTFCKDFLSSLLSDMSPTEFGRTHVLTGAIEKLAIHSINGEVYHRYCLNYSNALSYLETLRQKEDFQEFERWCQQDSRCNRLQLTDLLVAPMQHWTKLPLLISNIRKYTRDPLEKSQLTQSLQTIEKSLEKLQDKMRWVQNFERVQEIQKQIVWPVVADLDPRAFIPEFLKTSLSRQPCERLLVSPKRQLLHEGLLTLVEGTNNKCVEMYAFLFDDLLLITKVKKSARKKQSVAEMNPSNMKNQTEGAILIVQKQPMALDRFSIHDIGPSEAMANGLKNAFVLVQISRFQQIIGVFTLQALSESQKNTWLTHLREAKDSYAEREISRQHSFKETFNHIKTNSDTPLPSPSCQMKTFPQTSLQKLRRESLTLNCESKGQSSISSCSLSKTQSDDNHSTITTPTTSHMKDVVHSTEPSDMTNHIDKLNKNVSENIEHSDKDFDSYDNVLDYRSSIESGDYGMASIYL